MVVSEAELRGLAEDEMGLARRMSWHELKRVTPWGDTYTGFAANGASIEIERNYLWRDESKTAILIEVRLRPEQDPGLEIVETAVVTAKGFE